MPEQKELLCIIDGSSLLYRSFYGVRPLHTSRGEPTHAIYGFCRTIKKMIDELHPTHLVVVWDEKGPTHRHEAYSEYKATRQAAPSDLITQKEKIREFLSRVSITQVSQQGLEADDLIYSLARDTTAKNTLVVTGDKDLHQLITEKISVFDPFKQKIITQESFIEERGFEPQYLLLYHALLGDSSDNIPGVRGIGKKGAEELTKQFLTLDNLYQNIESVSKKRTQNLLTEQKEQANISAQLFTLFYKKVELSLSDFICDVNKWVQAQSFFVDLEIKPFHPKAVTKKAIDLYHSTQTLSEKNSDSPPSDVHQDLPGTSTGKPEKNKPWVAHIVDTEEKLSQLIKNIKTAKITAFDTETTGLKPFEDQMIGVSCAYNNHEAFYIPFGHVDPGVRQEDGPIVQQSIFGVPDQARDLTQQSLSHNYSPQLTRDYVLAELKPVLEDPAIKKSFQHAQFDCIGFAQYEIDVQGVVFDTLIAAFLLRKNSEKIGLKALSLRYLGEPMASFEQTLNGHKCLSHVPIQDAAQYAAHDALQTYKLTKILQELLEQDDQLLKLFNEIEMPLNRIIYLMQRTGIRLDTDKLDEIKCEAKKQLKAIKEKIAISLDADKHDINFETINFNSPKQLEVLLFDQLELPPVKKSKTGRRSTDTEVLHVLSKIHPVPGLIIKYRELFKLLSTYLEPLPLEINSKTRKIHTHYSQTIAATGRLSSSQPNLQNIPTGSGLGAQVRDAFVAPPGSQFLSADYSQIELRLLAHVTQDAGLLDAFKNKRDIHRETAAQIHGIPADEITNDQRQIGKKINFSIMYGLTPFGLSKDLEISMSEAKQYIESYFAQYPGVKTWMDEITEAGKHDGFVSTLMGRKRFVPGLHERNKNIFEAERRVAINSPIQGTAADIIKVAMIKIEERFRAENLTSKLVLQIHDELLLSVPDHEKKQVEAIVKEEMERVVDWEIDLEVELRWGKTWGKAGK